MDRLVLIILGISVVFAALTYGLHRLVKNKYIKYVPGVICLVIALRFGYLAKFGSQDSFLPLGNLIGFMMFLPGFVSSLISGIAIDILVSKGKLQSK